MTEPDVVAILRRIKTVAVLGASARPERAGYYVPEYLVEQGYEVHPVNPSLVGSRLFGRPVVGRLVDVPVRVDLVDVFRRSEWLPGHVDDILAMDPLPGVVWFQLDIRHDEVARVLEAAGITVVQDRCTLADHRRFLGGGSRPA